MLALEVIQIDSELGIILPKEVLDRLRVVEGDQILMTEEPDGLHMTSHSFCAQDQSLAKVISRTMS
jgi:hypothetical protein